ncbi:MAG TPA: PKD domain-containing protein [Thermoplasmata archaeon]|nr:PKD domain-containing protein [Thermoplasmata archaeon]
MKGFYARRSLALLLAGTLAVGTLALLSPPVPAPAQASLGFWEASSRGLVSVVMVNETFNENGHEVTAPVGILVTNTATVPVVIPEEAVLMSPHPSQSPPPSPMNTTADATLTNATVPAKGSLLYSFGPYVLAGYLSGPIWWDMEEMQFAKAGVAFRVGGETLPFGLRTLVEHPFYKGPGNNTQTHVWAYLRSFPTVVVGKLPLYTITNGTAGQTVRVRIDATNLAVWAYDDTYTANVNVTRGIVEDDVPAGWSVQAGSYSVPPDVIVNYTDGSKTLEWYANLPAAQVSYQGNPDLPTPYVTVTRFYTLVAPALPNGNVTLPRARSDMNRTGTPDAHSAPAIVAVVGNAPPIADAGGPYRGNEGDTIILNASKSSDPDGDPLQFRWSFTDNGSWDTGWSSSPTAAVRYTDEFSGLARVAVSDGHTVVTAVANVTIDNVPPAIRSLVMTATGDFRLTVAGKKPVNVTLTIRGNGTVLSTLRIVHARGESGPQTADTGPLSMNLSQPITATLRFSDFANCHGNRDRVWLNLTFPDGTSVALLHPGKGRHLDAAGIRFKDLRPLFIRHGISFRAMLSDPGADALTAHWAFGDGTNLTQVFPNGPANDTPESPVGGNAPMNVTAIAVHGYHVGGHHGWERCGGDGKGEGTRSRTYEITLTVTDADGASTSASLTISLGFGGHGPEDEDD